AVSAPFPAAAFALLQWLLLLDRLGIFRVVNPGRGDAGCRHVDHRLILGAALDRGYLAAATESGIAWLVAALLHPDLPPRLLRQLVGSSRNPFSHLVHVAPPGPSCLCLPNAIRHRVFLAPFHKRRTARYPGGPWRSRSNPSTQPAGRSSPPRWRAATSRARSRPRTSLPSMPAWTASACWCSASSASTTMSRSRSAGAWGRSSRRPATSPRPRSGGSAWS